MNKSGVTSLIDRTIKTLHHVLGGREDVISTTSFGYQSSLLFFLMSEAGVYHRCIYVSSQLTTGGQELQRGAIESLFDIDVTECDRTEWVTQALKGRSFFDLQDEERKNMCSELKRDPLKDFIREKQANIWMSGIRKDQSIRRSGLQFFETTDLGVIKIAPMYSWDKEDTQRIIKLLRLPINEDYVDFCKLNTSGECGLHY